MASAPSWPGAVLAEVGDVGRFPTKDHFATYNGTAPIDVSSGEQVRHRLSGSGNRRVNHALHIVAVVQIRNPKSEGHAYYERKRTEGKTSKEALRCLKRRLSDVIYRQLVADHYAKLVPCVSVYDRQANAVYFELTDDALTPGRTTLRAPTPPGVEAFIALNWKNDRFVGIEVLDADVILPAKLLAEAEDLT